METIRFCYTVDFVKPTPLVALCQLEACITHNMVANGFLQRGYYNYDDRQQFYLETSSCRTYELINLSCGSIVFIQLSYFIAQ